MAWTQSDLDAINAAYALGAVEVTYADGRKVRYRSLIEMEAIIRRIEEALGLSQRPSRVAGGYNSGLSS